MKVWLTAYFWTACAVLVEGSTTLSQLDVPPWYNAIIASCSTHNAGLVADSVRGVRGLFETVARANWCVIVALFPSLVLGDRYVAISCRCSRMHLSAGIDICCFVRKTMLGNRWYFIRQRSSIGPHTRLISNIIVNLLYIYIFFYIIRIGIC